MKNSIKKSLIIGTFLVLAFILGKVLFSSIGTVFTIIAVGAVAYFGYTKVKQIKAVKNLKAKTLPFQPLNQPNLYKTHQTEKETDFLFTLGDNRKEF